MESGKVFEKLVHLATRRGIIVRFCPFQAYDGRIKGNKIGIRQDLPTIEDFNYNLAHELAHAFLHYDKGNMMGSEKEAEYEEQADRAAKLLLAALEM